MRLTRRNAHHEKLLTLLPRSRPVRVENCLGGLARDQGGSREVIPWFYVSTGEPDRPTNRFAQRSHLLHSAVKPKEENEIPLMLDGTVKDPVKDFANDAGG